MGKETLVTRWEIFFVFVRSSSPDRDENEERKRGREGGREREVVFPTMVENDPVRPAIVTKTRAAGSLRRDKFHP